MTEKAQHNGQNVFLLICGLKPELLPGHDFQHHTRSRVHETAWYILGPELSGHSICSCTKGPDPQYLMFRVPQTISLLGSKSLAWNIGYLRTLVRYLGPVGPLLLRISGPRDVAHRGCGLDPEFGLKFWLHIKTMKQSSSILPCIILKSLKTNVGVRLNTP